MTVKFYTITDASNVVNKTINESDVTTVNNVDIFKPSSMENPQIVLTAFNDMLTRNYCYVGKFAKWYYITGITVTSAQRVVMDLSVDVLYTYRDEIKKCKGTAIRSESVGINTITDSKYPVDPCRHTLDLVNFDKTPFTRNATMPYILTTIGGTYGS